MSKMVINEQRTFKEHLSKYLKGFLILLYAGILIGSAWTKDCTLQEWYYNFCQFVLVEHHFIVGFTKATPLVVLVFEFAWFVVWLIDASEYRHPFAGREHGDAHWSTAEAVSKKVKDIDEKNLVKINFGDMPEPEEPVYVNTENYWLADDIYLSMHNKYTSNLNFEVIGPPGTGKSFRLVRPVLSQLCGSYMVTDPKGELSQQCGQFFEDNGYGTFVINCESEEGMKNSHHFNPFMYLQNESDILTFAEVLFKSTRPADAQSGDQFFEDMAQIALTDILYLMFYTYPKEKQDWRHFVELLNSTTVRQNPQTGAIDISDPDHLMQRFIIANNKWMEEHDGEQLKGFVDVEKIYTNAPETASSIISSLDAHAKFMKLDCVIDLLSSDDLDFVNNFGYGKKRKNAPTGKYTLFIITSENVRHFDWIPSMIYSMFFEKLYFITGNDPTLHQHLVHQLTCLMDEFANVTLPADFVGLTSTFRSRGISVFMIIQNLHQLKEKFPNNDQDKNLRGNMCTTIILGGPDNESCDTLSKEFGNRTIHKRTTGQSNGQSSSSSKNEDVMEYPLLPAQDIHEMAKDGPCAVKIKGVGKLWISKVRFEDSPLCPLLTRKTPYQIKNYKTKEIVYDEKKSFLDQLPDVFFGSAADRFISECEEDDKSIMKLNPVRTSMLSLIQSSEEAIPGQDGSTEEFWNTIEKTTKEIILEKQRNELNLDDFINDELLTVQQLKNNKFTGAQINALSPFIHKGYKYEEITKYFNNEMTLEDINMFASRVANVKQAVN